MKKSLKKLKLKKITVSKLEMNTIKGGMGTGPTALMCNSVPRHLGGIGCHMF